MPVAGEIALLLFIAFILLLEFMICGNEGGLLKKRKKIPYIRGLKCVYLTSTTVSNTSEFEGICTILISYLLPEVNQ